MTTINDGKVTINGQYGVTVNRGDYSSEKFSLAFGIEYAIEDGTDLAQAAAEGKAQEEVIATLVKEAVLSELGLDAKFNDDGKLVADFGSAPKAAPAPAASAPQSGFLTPSGGSGGGGGQKYGPPKVAKEVVDAQPTITADLDGRGVTTFRDLRALKAAPGTEAGPGQYSAKAADFRDLADAKHVVWLRASDGSYNQQVVDALQAAGQEVA